MSAGGPLGTSVKVVERPGAKIHSGLSRNDPFRRTLAREEDVHIMNQEESVTVIVIRRALYTWLNAKYAEINRSTLGNPSKHCIQDVNNILMTIIGS